MGFEPSIACEERVFINLFEGSGREGGLLQRTLARLRRLRLHSTSLN